MPEDEYALEESFDNGVRYACQQITAELLSMKSRAFGVERDTIDRIINVVKKVNHDR